MKDKDQQEAECVIRRGFRAILARAVPAYYIDAMFSMASSIVLSLVVIFWQSSSVVLYEMEDFILQAQMLG
jgi:hypothetical protein